MIKVTSISGGLTSAYVSANYETDYRVFSLVRTENKKDLFPDKKLRQMVEDRIQKPFIATAEDNTIIYTIFDLEQFLGKPIDWLSGITFDEVIKKKGGWLPNKLHRYCTTWLKIDPIFYWSREKIGEPFIMNIGYRANETRRQKSLLEKCNQKGFLEFKGIIGQSENGRNKWKTFEFEKPEFPLIKDQIFKDTIENYWKDKPVRFAPLNNCVGCFHRNPILLRKQFDWHPEKMQWFANQEGGKKGFFRSDMSYSDIKKHHLQMELTHEDFSPCDSGYCGI